MKNNYDKQIGILDWLIFFSIFILIFMVYIPLNVWEEENHYKKIRRERMRNIASAEEFYYELTGEYTTNINDLFSLVEAAMDSLIADSTFVGKQLININNKSFEVKMDESFHIRVDTTYSIPEEIKYETIDTLYRVGMRNEDNKSLIDTIWINSENYTEYINNDNFIEEYITHYENSLGNIINIEEINKNQDKYNSSGFLPKKMKQTKRMTSTTNYIRRKFHLEEKFIYCPISKNNLDKKKFILDIDESNPDAPVFSIFSPLDKSDNELRFGIFRYRPGKEESIIAGVQSWAGQ